jgi:hypothetical protein
MLACADEVESGQEYCVPFKRSGQVENDENWLHFERVDCPSCHTSLCQVDHSPFYDEVFRYCDRCPIHAEVSYYDPVYERVFREHPPSQSRAAWFRAPEAELKPCVCGGSFRHESARRCLACSAPVIVDEPAGVDLLYWSDALLPGAPDMSDEELEAGFRRHEPFVRRQDLWKDA